MSTPPLTDGSANGHWIRAMEHVDRNQPVNAASTAAEVARAAVLEAEIAAQAVVDTQALVLAAARVVAEAAAASARAVAAAVAAKAAVVAAAAEAAVEARQIEARLTHEVLHDELTGLPNRRLLHDRLEQALARSNRTGAVVAVLFLDLDRFKSVNDQLGHATGDRVLVGVAALLRGCLRDTDTCARAGGDEFVIVCEDMADPTDASTVATKIEESLAAGVRIGRRVVRVRASIGVALSAPGSSLHDLLEEADTAMYQSKSRGSDHKPEARSPAPRNGTH